MTEISWLVAVGSNIAHVAKHGRESVYAIGRTPYKPELPGLGEVLCGVRPDWWAVATVDLYGFDKDPYEECLKCKELRK